MSRLKELFTTRGTHGAGVYRGLQGLSPGWPHVPDGLKTSVPKISSGQFAAKTGRCRSTCTLCRPFPDGWSRAIPVRIQIRLRSARHCINAACHFSKACRPGDQGRWYLLRQDVSAVSVWRQVERRSHQVGRSRRRIEVTPLMCASSTDTLESKTRCQNRRTISCFHSSISGGVSSVSSIRFWTLEAFVS